MNMIRWLSKSKLECVNAIRQPTGSDGHGAGGGGASASGGGGGEGGGGGGEGGGTVRPGGGGAQLGVTSEQLTGHANSNRAIRAGVFTGAVPVWQRSPMVVVATAQFAQVHSLSR